MKFDAALPPTSLTKIPNIARAAETIGFDTLWVSETHHDPFLPGPLIAEHTQSVAFGTAIAVSFARSPGTMAYTAWDLAQASRGRFILGLGTQVKPHIERRFGLGWPASPVGMFREQIQAIRALWRCWQTGERLNFRGKHYKLTLMSPFFNPGPIDHPEIPIYIAGVNTGMAHLAGETADGFHAHPLNSPRYLQEIVLPAIGEGAKKSGRSQSDCDISITAFFATNEKELDFVRSQVSFYASTPSYRAIMALHGWADTAQKLSRLASRGKWDDMPALISDEMLSEFAILGSEDTLADQLKQRYKGLVDRVTLYTPFLPGERDHFWINLVNAFNPTT